MPPTAASAASSGRFGQVASRTRSGCFGLGRLRALLECKPFLAEPLSLPRDADPAIVVGAEIDQVLVHRVGADRVDLGYCADRALEACFRRGVLNSRLMPSTPRVLYPRGISTRTMSPTSNSGISRSQTRHRHGGGAHCDCGEYISALSALWQIRPTKLAGSGRWAPIARPMTDGDSEQRRSALVVKRHVQVPT